MVNYVVGSVAHSIERAGGVEVAWHSRAQVHVLAQALPRTKTKPLRLPFVTSFSEAFFKHQQAHTSLARSAGSLNLDSGGLVEVAGADALAHDVPVAAARDELHLLGDHDVLQLLPHLTHLAHRLHVDEVLAAPARRVPDSISPRY